MNTVEIIYFKNNHKITYTFQPHDYTVMACKKMVEFFQTNLSFQYVEHELLLKHVPVDDEHKFLTRETHHVLIIYYRIKP